MAENLCRNCRKVGEKLLLKGERCESQKCTMTRRAYAPGSHAGQSRRKKSEYALQLQEKQKAKFEYGLRERQFRNYFVRAAKSQEATGEILLQLLERRLDNVLYRLGWASSRAQARQLVNHGHVKVNGKVVDIPSYITGIKDKIEPANTDLIARTSVKKPTPPKWLKVEKKGDKAEVESLPTREQIDTPIEEQLIVEFYSR